jgi:hypothetical protein
MSEHGDSTHSRLRKRHTVRDLNQAHGYILILSPLGDCVAIEFMGSITNGCDHVTLAGTLKIPLYPPFEKGGIS